MRATYKIPAVFGLSLAACGPVGSDETPAPMGLPDVASMCEPAEGRHSDSIPGCHWAETETPSPQAEPTPTSRTTLSCELPQGSCCPSARLLPEPSRPPIVGDWTVKDGEIWSGFELESAGLRTANPGVIEGRMSIGSDYQGCAPLLFSGRTTPSYNGCFYWCYSMDFSVAVANQGGGYIIRLKAQEGSMDLNCTLSEEAGESTLRCVQGEDLDTAPKLIFTR